MSVATSVQPPDNVLSASTLDSTSSSTTVPSLLNASDTTASSMVTDSSQPSTSKLMGIDINEKPEDLSVDLPERSASDQMDDINLNFRDSMFDKTPLETIPASPRMGTDETLLDEPRGDAMEPAVHLVAPEWAPTNGGCKIVLIGTWDSTRSYTCTFDTISVDATHVRDGVLSCVCPPHGAGEVELTVKCKATESKSSPFTFQFKRVVFLSESQSEDIPGDSQDFTWNDFLQNGMQKLHLSNADNMDDESDEKSTDDDAKNKTFDHHARTIQLAFRRYKEANKKKREAVVRFFLCVSDVVLRVW